VRDFHHHVKGDMPDGGRLPPRARDLLRLPWSVRQERRYQRFAALWRSRPVNWVWDHLPMRLRYNGYALKGYARG
jgi:uncharacterized protein (DUF2236 family)